MEWKPMGDGEYELAFSGERGEESCIGHMRADFGSGAEFWHTWWPHVEGLKTETFVSEFQKVVDELRDGPLKDLYAMKHYCWKHPDAIMPENFSGKSWGFLCKTEDQVYALRLCEYGYHVYLYAYNRDLLEQGQSAVHQQGMGMS